MDPKMPRIYRRAGEPRSGYFEISAEFPPDSMNFDCLAPVYEDRFHRLPIPQRRIVFNAATKLPSPFGVKDLLTNASLNGGHRMAFSEMGSAALSSTLDQMKKKGVLIAKKINGGRNAYCLGDKGVAGWLRTSIGVHKGTVPAVEKFKPRAIGELNGPL
ncbi:MAG: hypothetical protein K9G62_01625 [Alphaproteobacteria bacterium]|nr:hypothetical protein [Alphaproteobacteria bacterium]